MQLAAPRLEEGPDEVVRYLFDLFDVLVPKIIPLVVIVGVPILDVGAQVYSVPADATLFRLMGGIRIR